MNTPTMLARTLGYCMLGQALLILVVAAAVDGGASLLVTAGFVTAYYDHNLFAIRLLAVPWTAPAVYVSVQTVVQMFCFSALVASVSVLVRTNRWQHGVLPNSTHPGRDVARPQTPGSGPGMAAGAPFQDPASGPPPDWRPPGPAPDRPPPPGPA